MIRRAVQASLERRPRNSVSCWPPPAKRAGDALLARSFPPPPSALLLLLPAVPALILYAASDEVGTKENRRSSPSFYYYIHHGFSWKNQPSFLSIITSEGYPSPSRTRCEASSDKDNNSDNDNDNPLWPSGVPPAMVNVYVDEILSDPKINLASVPDAIERALYVTTVQTTLNTVYQALSGLHGTELLGHVLILKRVTPTETGAAAAFSWKDLPAHHPSGRRIDKKVLRAMADELLRNRAINQAWLPDVLERQIYANCLLIIFTLLDRLADTLSRTGGPGRALVRRQQQQKLQLDTATIDALVEGMLRETREQQKQQSSSTSSSSYWPQHIPLQDKVLFSVHKTLYSLILGIVDDILSKTEIRILSETIQMQMVRSDELQRRATERAARRRQTELQRAVDRETQMRHLASAMAVVSAVSIAAVAVLVSSSSSSSGRR